MKKLIAIFIAGMAVSSFAQINTGGTGGGGSGTVNAGTTGAIAIYTGNGTTVGPTGAGVVGSAMSVVPSGTGQVISTGDWYGFGQGVAIPGTPTLTASVSGGTLNTASNNYVRLTFVGLAFTVPSAEVLLQMNATTGCGSGSACSFTITMPTNCTAGNLPVGATGCTVWTSGTNNTEKQQTASAACVNITAATCVVGTLGVGSNLSATASATSGISPPNAITTGTPDFIIPLAWNLSGNGNYYAVMGMDTSALNWIGCCTTAQAITAPSKTGFSAGVLSFLDNVFFNDDVSTPPISNTMISMRHQSGASTATGTNTGAGNPDDRILAARIDNDQTAKPNYEQYLGFYIENFIDNNATFTNPVGGGAAWGESAAAAVRGITTDNRSAGANTVSGEGVVGIASTSIAAPNCGGSIACAVGIKGGAFEAAGSTNLNGAAMIGVLGGVNGSSPNSNGTGYAFYAESPTVRFATQTVGYRSTDFGTNNADWDFLASGNGTTSGRSIFQGNVYLPNIVSSFNTINVTGSFAIVGGISTAQMPTASQPTVTPFGTAGANTVTYKVTGVDTNGNETAASTQNQTTTANADLTAVHGNTINFPAQVAGYTSWNVYRTSSGGSTCNGGACTNGKIGTQVVPLMSTGQNNASSFNDTGQVGDGNTAVSQPNLTGGASLSGYVKQLGAVRTTAAFTTAANTNLQTITGLSWNLPNIAQNYAFHCAGFYSQATGLAAVSFGIQAATNAPTNINATGTMYTGATAVQDGVLAGLATTTATNIVSSTPAGTGVNTTFYLDGTIENPAAINTINIMVSTAASADAVTVGRGTTCQLWITGN